MEAAACLLICGNTALYLALICQLRSSEGAFPAMLLALGLGFVMLLLAARFRFRTAVRIALAPLPFLSLLLLPPGPAWIAFFPAPLVMALCAALDRFDWDNWRTSRWMTPVLLAGALLTLHFALHSPPIKEGVALCAIFFLFGIVGLRMQRMGYSMEGRTLLNVGGVLLPIAIGAGAGAILWLILARGDLLLTLLYWLFYPLIWLARQLIKSEQQQYVDEEIFNPPMETAPAATPPPFDPIETSPTVLHMPDVNWSLWISVLFAVAAIAVIVVAFSRRVHVRQEDGQDVVYFSEKREQKRSKHRPRSTRAVNRVREAYRSYLVMLSVRRGIRLSESDTSLQVQQRAAELPGQDAAEELRQIYLQARYAGKASPEDARRAEADVKKLRERLLSEDGK